MRYLPLNHGMYAKVGEEDWDYLRQWKWRVHSSGRGRIYVSRGVNLNGKDYTCYLHHEVLQLKMSLKAGTIVDHKNGDTLDCQKKNLRISSASDNMANTGPRIDKVTSKYKGVNFDIRDRRWLARFTYRGKVYQVGRFKDEYTAVVAYNLAVGRVVGEFAYVNRWTGPTEPAPGKVRPGAKDHYAPAMEPYKIREVMDKRIDR